MSEKKDIPIEEKILRYIFDSKFYPEFEDVPFEDASPVTDLIAKSRDYGSARNIILDAASKDPEILDELKYISKIYEKNYKKDGETWISENMFSGDLPRLLQSINVEDLPIEYIASKSESIAQALGYEGGWNEMYSKIPELYKGVTDKKSLRNYVSKELAKRTTNDNSALNELDKTLLKYRLGFSDNSDDDYILDKLSDYITRSVTYELNNEHKKEHPYGYGFSGFVAPNSQAKNDKGLPANAIDVLADLAQIGVGGAAGKSALGAREAAEAAGNLASRGVMPLAKPAAYAGASSGGLSFLHDLGDSLTTKHVYSEGEDGKEISKRGDAMAVLANIPEYAFQSLLGASLAIPLMGASMGAGAIGKAGSVIKNKVGSAIDRLFGTKNSKSMMNQLVQGKNGALEKLEKNTESAMDILSKNTISSNNALKETYKKIDDLESNPILKTKGKSTEPQRNEINAKIDKARKEAEKLERKIKGSDLERNSILDYKNRATKHILDNFDPAIARLDNEIAKKNVIPNAIFYTLASKDIANNVPEKRVSTKGLLRLLNAPFGK